jgi:hypothetical protein
LLAGGVKVIKNLMDNKSGGDPSQLLRKPDMPGGLRVSAAYNIEK